MKTHSYISHTGTQTHTVTHHMQNTQLYITYMHIHSYIPHTVTNDTHRDTVTYHKQMHIHTELHITHISESSNYEHKSLS